MKRKAMTKHAKHLAIPAIAVAGVFAAGMVPPALAANTDVSESASANWSGYVVKGSQSGSFSSVSGSWVEPTADCSSGSGDAAFWIGLGGASEQSGALEQVGTQVDCGAGGSGQHYAWYELVPAAPVRLDVAINPGDHVSARVSVNGTSVTVSLSNTTTGASATKNLQMDNPDTSSAEWIAEAPSVCQGADASNISNCTPVTLANFGTVKFTGASATSNGTTGTISSGNWSAQAVQLNGGLSGVGDGSGLDVSAGGNSASATPSSLSGDGASFSVSYQADGSQGTSSSYYPGDPSAGYGPGGSGYGYGDGSGYGYGNGSGYGYGYGYGSGYGYYGAGNPWLGYGAGGYSYGAVGY
jgi:hypothetical protein